MKRIIIIIQCLALMLLVTPMQSNAEENGLYLTNKFTALNNGTTYNYEIYSDNPDAKVLVFTSLDSVAYNSYMNAYYYAQPIWVMSIGGDSNISVYKNGVLMSSSGGFIEALDMDVINSNLLTNLKVGSLDNNANIGAIEGNWSNYYMNDSAYKLVEFSDVYGYFINVPYDENVGDPTYATVKYAVENIDDLKVQPEEYDATMPTPELVNFRDTKSSLVRVNNGNNYNVEYKIKLYGPSEMYFSSENLINIKYEVSGEFPSGFYNYKLPDTSILRIGSNHGNSFSGYSHIYYDCMVDFESFCKECSDNVVFDYENSAVEVLVGKAYYRDYISWSNYDFYDYEVYARFYDDTGSSLLYGDWSHLVVKRDGTSSSGNAGEETPDEDDDNRNDEDLQPSIPDFSDYEDFDASNLWEFIEGLVGSLGQIPSIVSQIFGFLPDWVLWMLGIGIGAIVILRFLGR